MNEKQFELFMAGIESAGCADAWHVLEPSEQEFLIGQGDRLVDKFDAMWVRGFGYYSAGELLAKLGSWLAIQEMPEVRK